MAAVNQSSAYPEKMPVRQRETSITAHVVRMGTVTMAFAELDAIVDMLRDRENDSQVAYEFIQAVESIR